MKNDFNQPIYICDIEKYNLIHNEPVFKEFENRGFIIVELDQFTSKEEVIMKIRKNKFEKIIVVSKSENLFINFNRPVVLVEVLTSEIGPFFSLKEHPIESNLERIIFYFRTMNLKMIKRCLYSFFNIYNINIEELVLDTTYESSLKDFEKFSLLNLIEEDLDLYQYKMILSSRLAIILYRLCFFNLHAKKTAIGRFYQEKLNIRSKPYNFPNLNDNQDGFYFISLLGKPFRGYKLSLVERAKVEIPSDLFLEKIKIAKRLLKAKVKMKIVAEALEIKESELNKNIYS